MDSNKWLYAHLHPKPLEDKDLFLRASSDIESSFTGRIDILTSGLHRFFLESSKLIRNAIKLYEEGFFDAAFYSVRSALELARIVAYFSHVNEPRNSEIYKKWAGGEKFPFDSKIKKELEESGSVYIEIYEVLPEFFNKQKENLARVQKYIHKQGYKTFYERGFTNPEKEQRRQERITEDFHQFIKDSLTEIALLRLCIDPFPVLLRDESVMYKIHFEAITYPFSDRFISEIIGIDKIKLYCSTEFYQSHLDYFKDNEDLSVEAHILINNQFYDRKSWPTIKTQLHLLSPYAAISVKIFNISEKISKVFMRGGWTQYFSNIDSKRIQTRFDSNDLLRVKNADKKINSEYEGAYLSYFDYEDDGIWIEHNSQLDTNDEILVSSILVETK